MHNLEDIIEKYRHELMAYSQKSPVHSYDSERYEEKPGFVAAMADVVPVQQTTTPEEIRLSTQRPYASYEDFQRRNTSSGTLKVQVYTGASFPISNARVVVTIDLPDGEREIYSGYTDMDGILEGIRLPAPDSEYSLDENSTVEPYSVYNVRVTHPRFADGTYKNVPVFDSVNSIQPVNLVPLTSGGGEPGETVVDEQPMTLFGGEN